MSGEACSPVARIPFWAEALIVLRQIRGDEQVVLSFPITLMPSSKHFSMLLSISFDWLLKISMAHVLRIISLQNI